VKQEAGQVLVNITEELKYDYDETSGDEDDDSFWD
jgi:hypothetical protein